MSPSTPKSLLLEVRYTTAMSEESLPGGLTDGAVRIGGVVHKRASPWTPTVHALPRHLEYADVDGVPRALGFDEQGRQMLAYVPGDTVGNRTPWPAWVHRDSTLIQVGRWLRRVHDATVSFVPPTGERWFIGGTVRPGLIVGHQDAAPYNAVVDGDRLVGFCDWDTAAPSSREFDLALSALWWVPLCPPSAVEPLGFHDFDGRSRRLHLLLDAYGYDGDRQGFGAVVVQRARRQAAAIRQMADGVIRPGPGCCSSRSTLSRPRRISRRCRPSSGRLSAGSCSMSGASRKSPIARPWAWYAAQPRAGVGEEERDIG
jgi:hypothetical protein